MSFENRQTPGKPERVLDARSRRFACWGVHLASLIGVLIHAGFEVNGAFTLFAHTRAMITGWEEVAY